MPFSPTPKKAGDPLQSGDWNDHINETVRLGSAKVDRAGDTITGDLTISGALCVDATNQNKGNIVLNTPFPGLRFGPVASGEGIASQRTTSGNPAADNIYGLDFYSNFIKRLSITNNGNIGIGRPNPVFPLHFPDSLGDKIVLWGSDPNIHYGFGIQNAQLQIMTGSPTNAVVFGSGSSQNIKESMRITGDGNLIVQGAITPGAGNLATKGIMFPTNPGGGSGNSAYIRYYARSGEACTMELGITNDGDDHIALMPGGNVGIGTVAPSAKLQVVGNDFLNNQFNWQLQLSATKDASYGAFASLDATQLNGGKQYLIFSTGNKAGEGQGKLVFKNQTDNITSLTISANGNVGIGNTNPVFPLQFADVLGDKIVLWGNNNNLTQHYGLGIGPGQLQIMCDGTGSAITFGYGSSANFTETMRIGGNGNIRMGNDYLVGAPAGRNVRIVAGGNWDTPIGCTVAKQSQGVYRITFSVPFNMRPFGSATQIFPYNDGGAGDIRDNAKILNITNTFAVVGTGDGNGGLSDRWFTFIFIGW